MAKNIKISQSGEYWIMDGQAIFCDGDIGDYNHEAYAIQTVQQEITEEDDPDWEYWKQEKALEILEQKEKMLKDQEMMLDEEIPNEYQQIQKTKSELDKILEMKNNIDYHADEIVYDNLNQLGIDPYAYIIADGQGDARLWGMQKYGWKRLEGNHIETYTLTKSDLDDIADGLWDAYVEEAERMNYYIEVVSNKKFYMDVPWDVVSGQNLMKLRKYDSQSNINPQGRPNYSCNWYMNLKISQNRNISQYEWYEKNKDKDLNDHLNLVFGFHFSVSKGKEWPLDNNIYFVPDNTTVYTMYKKPKTVNYPEKYNKVGYSFMTKNRIYRFDIELLEGEKQKSILQGTFSRIFDKNLFEKYHMSKSMTKVLGDIKATNPYDIAKKIEIMIKNDWDNDNDNDDSFDFDPNPSDMTKLKQELGINV